MNLRTLKFIKSTGLPTMYQDTCIIFREIAFSNFSKNHGFRLKEHLPMKFDSFYVSMLSTKYQQGNTNYVESFLSGLKSNRVGAKHNNNYSSIIYIFEKK